MAVSGRFPCARAVQSAHSVPYLPSEGDVFLQGGRQLLLLVLVHVRLHLMTRQDLPRPRKTRRHNTQDRVPPSHGPPGPVRTGENTASQYTGPGTSISRPARTCPDRGKHDVTIHRTGYLHLMTRQDLPGPGRTRRHNTQNRVPGYLHLTARQDLPGPGRTRRHSTQNRVS